MSQPRKATNFLEKNLKALARTNPKLVERLEKAEPADIQWEDAKTGTLTGALSGVSTGTSGVSSGASGSDNKSFRIASRFDPDKEADKLIADVDLREHGCVVVLGMGLGYHVQKLAKKMGRSGILIVFEPDLGTLRAVLERIDHSEWLGRPTIALADDAMERGDLIARLDAFASIITQGAFLVTHPMCRQKYPETLKRMADRFKDLLGYCRTNIATALVNSSRTVENLTLNIGYYTAGNTTDELHDVAKDKPAICVAAGPSLSRNIKWLTDPNIRKNYVLITVQTALKVLLQHGIKPDYVTALDYAEISRRFYEDLPDIDGVTLVAEPKAHPTILDHFPGPIRVTNSNFLDRLSGDLVKPRKPVRDGATVAHLSFYLAQHMGCNPIAMVGQDLGFSDGLYYMPGTAIHEVWAPEMNRCNTLEMMEWQRIMRHKPYLIKRDDANGQGIFSDEQMMTYLKQFERDFAHAPQQVIDCTEGGQLKTDTEQMPLKPFLEKYCTSPVGELPVSEATFDIEALRKTLERLELREREVVELRQISVRSVPILKDLMKHHRDPHKGSKLFEKLKPEQKRIEELHESFQLINQLCTIGSFNRAKRDRQISFEVFDDEYAKQEGRLHRDLANLEWLIKACDEARRIFSDGIARTRQLLAKVEVRADKNVQPSGEAQEKKQASEKVVAHV